MALIFVNMDGAQNVCGHCGFEFFVKFEEMTITPVAVSFPRCPGCKVAFENCIAVPEDNFGEDAAEDRISMYVASQTLYKRALGKAKKIDISGSDKFPNNAKRIKLAKDDGVVEAPLPAPISKLREKNKKEGKEKT